MFREMRRKKQQLPMEEVVRMLEEGTSGVLALSGEGGYPYAVPMSYVFEKGKLFFHSAQSGHKMDAIERESKASFCVIGKDQVIPHAFTTAFRSVIVFGKIRALEDDREKREAIKKLAQKYSPKEDPARVEKEIDREWNRLCVLEMAVEHMTGKEAIELTKERLNHM